MTQFITSDTKDTDSDIVKIQMHRELQFWISHLEEINIESEVLAKVAFNKLADKALRDQLLNCTDDTIMLLNKLFSYKNSLNHFDECDEIDCDMHFVQQHETICERYRTHIKNYGELKSKLFLMLV